MTQSTLFTLVPIVKSHGPYAEEQLGLLLYKGGTVCDAGFTDIAADAICKEMNFEQAIYWSTDPRPEAEQALALERSLYEIKLGDVECNFSNWNGCSFNDKVSHCRHSQDIFLSCQLKGGSVF